MSDIDSIQDALKLAILAEVGCTLTNDDCHVLMIELTQIAALRAELERTKTQLAEYRKALIDALEELSETAE